MDVLSIKLQIINCVCCVKINHKAATKEENPWNGFWHPMLQL